MNRQGLYQIGEVAERVGLSLRTLRYYEEVGLVCPSRRSPGGFRLYDEADIERAEFIKGLKPLEFSLDQIRELLDVRDDLMGPVPVARSDLADRLEKFVAVAEERSRILLARSQAAETLAVSLRRLLRKAGRRTSTRT